MINLDSNKKVRRHLLNEYQIELKETRKIKGDELQKLLKRKQRRNLMDHGFTTRELKGLNSTVLHQMINENKNISKNS